MGGFSQSPGPCVTGPTERAGGPAGLSLNEPAADTLLDAAQAIPKMTPVPAFDNGGHPYRYDPEDQKCCAAAKFAWARMLQKLLTKR